MPHLIYEYTDNLRGEADIDLLLRRSSQCLIDQNGVFPTGGIRTRAICLHEYCIADGMADDAFVHATLKIGAGRSEAVVSKVGDDLFAIMTTHFAGLYARRGLALSLEIVMFSESGTWKQNNLHTRYRKA